MRWFKHYEDAGHSESLSELKRDTGMAGYGRYWCLLEYLTRKFDGENYTFKIPKDVLRALFQIHSYSVLSSFALRLGSVKGLSVLLIPNGFQFEAPILLDLLGRDFRSARQARATTAPKNKNKNKIEIKKEEEQVLVQNTNPRQRTSLILFKNEQEVLSKIPIPTMDRWLALYDAEYLRRETLKAWNYYANNPRKVPKSLKGWTQALSSWYERGWKYHVKEIASVEDNSADAWLRRKLKEEQSL